MESFLQEKHSSIVFVVENERFKNVHDMHTFDLNDYVEDVFIKHNKILSKRKSGFSSTLFHFNNLHHICGSFSCRITCGDNNQGSFFDAIFFRK